MAERRAPLLLHNLSTTAPIVDTTLQSRNHDVVNVVEEMQEDCEWRPTNPDFDEWLKDQIERGYVRIAA